ncbi:hypothetical protein [Tabrizicola oligotrophica]|uniref:Uncharacterized protein n=1 Tax=Tabrizicola oligotrophica TaxID=2710650 RepID=A0A6M0QXG5_9RHOB|nr:hypothetical protein [Tabrizicola oligotrophica]NEY91631.1 hypothetical protein [Tabrizicola oligotrophica]
MPRLEKLDPFFLSSERSNQLRKHGKADLSSMNVSSEVKWHRENIYTIESKYLETVFPLLKLISGLGEIDDKELVEDLVTSMRDAVEQLTKESGRTLQSEYVAISALLDRVELEMRENLSRINLSQDVERFSSVRAKIASLGNISQIPVERVAETVFNQMTDDGRTEITTEYPRGFAQNFSNRAERLTAFSLTLYSLGAIAKTGRNYSGAPSNQKSKFRAQFLDCLHIGEAGYFDAFVTCDAGAHRLAGAVYSYAGLPTLSLQMTFN